MRLALPLSALLLLALPLSAIDCVELPYATDQCVRLKLDAAAAFCDAALTGTVSPDDSAAFLADWAAADDIAADRGVDCTDTTITANQMAADVLNAAPGAQGVATAGLTGPASCSADLLDAAGRLCAEVIVARGSHFTRRVTERNRDRVVAEIAEAEADHAAALAAAQATGCGFANDVATVQASVHGLVDQIVDSTTISPNVPLEWTSVVPGPVEYEGRTWTPSCWDGADYRFFVKRGTENKLLINYEGGGACWDIFTCGLAPTFKRSIDPDGNPGNFPFGFADDTNPDNPFRNWHKVYVPYCTGDIHWGDALVNHQQLDPETGEVVNEVTVRHNGHVNARVVEKWTREHFVDPEQVFVTGSSAGAYGAIGNSVWWMEKVYTSTDFAVMGDAGNGVVTQDFTANEISKWGIETLLPDWIPELNVPVAQLDAADLYAAAAETYPTNRFATFTFAYDGGQGGQTGFYNIMLNPGAIFLWPSWWNATCAWNQGMLALNADSAARAPNFRFYVGAGSSHTTFFRDRVYTQTTGNVPTIASWVQAMVDDTAAWTNVLCDDCEDVLPDDPRPNPPQPPFTADDRIECAPAAAATIPPNFLLTSRSGSVSKFRIGNRTDF